MNNTMNHKPTRRGVLYARVSSKDQEQEGYSIPAQQKLLREYARDHAMTIAHEFVDIETAKATGRSGFGQMIALLREDPACRIILAEKTDRLYRNIRDWITVDELDVEVHFVKEGQIVSRASRSSDKFMHGIKVLMAKNYVDNLSEEVKKGLREKAEQGYWPSVAPVGYVNNVATHRIEPDPVRGPLITNMFDWYKSGTYSLKALTEMARAGGLTHPRSGRPMLKAEIHRILQNPIYFGEFKWLGRRYQGSHQPLITRELFEQAQAVLRRKPRARYPRQRHAFMGLLTCGRCGCAITAERKKGKYTYYRCTGFHGACGNTYIREEALGALLGSVVAPIQITPAIAEELVAALQKDEAGKDTQQLGAVRQLERRRSETTAKLDRGYEDYISGKISDAFWTRKSEEWEADLRAIAAEQTRLKQPRPALMATATHILELAKSAEFLYKSQDPGEQRRLLQTVLSNCTLDQGNLCPTYSKPFDLLVQGNQTGWWRGRRDSNPRPPA
jgi:site-specific DNA recombinase